MRGTRRSASLATALAGLLLAGGRPAAAQGPGVAERVAALKQSLAQSQATLQQYEWIETTAVSLKGEEKSRKQNRCYHGADGGVQKVPVAAPPPPDKKRGLRGKIAENKKEELSDYMEQAVTTVKLYVPPSPDRIQAAKDAGRVSFTPNPPAQRVRIDFRDYQKPGDLLTVEVDPANNRLLGVTVSTYIQDAKDAVVLDVDFAALADGTTYPASVRLDAKAKGVTVDVKNSGYRKLGN
jgi:hypothetical protein